MYLFAFNPQVCVCREEAGLESKYLIIVSMLRQFAIQSCPRLLTMLTLCRRLTLNGLPMFVHNVLYMENLGQNSAAK